LDAIRDEPFKINPSPRWGEGGWKPDEVNREIHEPRERIGFNAKD
jgi:hypothetical protein